MSKVATRVKDNILPSGSAEVATEETPLRGIKTAL